MTRTSFEAALLFAGVWEFLYCALFVCIEVVTLYHSAYSVLFFVCMEEVVTVYQSSYSVLYLCVWKKL